MREAREFEEGWVGPTSLAQASRGVSWIGASLIALFACSPGSQISDADGHDLEPVVDSPSLIPGKYKKQVLLCTLTVQYHGIYFVSCTVFKSAPVLLAGEHSALIVCGRPESKTRCPVVAVESGRVWWYDGTFGLHGGGRHHG